MAQDADGFYLLVYFEEFIDGFSETPNMMSHAEEVWIGLFDR